ncbi:MAG: galactose oxidase early set domain-containing protein, partial [Actinomycetes bacterium]
TGQWTTLASNQVPRYYHSVAVLLPDGRVLVGGGWGGNGGILVRQRSYEIFSPPYLFKGPRPAIFGGPGAAGYGTAFTLGVPNASDIASVALIPPAAVTHNFDENQRFVPLGFNVIPGGLQVAAPPNANYAPPGPYMLWIVNKNGVPSVAHWINID